MKKRKNLYDMYKKKSEIREHTGAIYSLASDSKFVYSSAADKFVTRWDISTGEQDSFAIRCDSTVYKILFIPNRNLLVLGTSLGDIHIIDTISKSEIKFLKYHKSAIFEMNYDVFTDRLYVGDAEGILSVWEIDEWKLIITLPFDCGKIRSIFIVEKFNFLFIGSQDGYLRVLDLKSFNLINEFKAHDLGCMSIFYSEIKKNILFTVGKDGYLKSWNLIDFRNVLNIPAHNEAIYKLKIANSDLVTISRDKSLKIWDINTLDFKSKIDKKTKGHTHSINDLLTIDNYIVTCGDDKRIIFWESVLEHSI